MTRATATALLIVATIIWGSAFIAQKSAMGSMEPFTFLAARYLLGGILILPLAIWESRRVNKPITKKGWQLIGLLIIAFFFGSWLQQIGLLTASVTNTGFLTGFYVFFVPILMVVFTKAKLHNLIWVAAALAFSGLFLLSGGKIENFVIGDYYVFASSFFWAMYVFFLGTTAQTTQRPITVSAIIFLIGGSICAAGALGTETVTIEAIQIGWVEILYTGILSTAIGFTLHTVSQQHVPTANAALILSMESLFAAIGAAIILGERLSSNGYLGIVLIFSAIVLAEAGPVFFEKARRKRTAVGNSS
ncbi:DMT family transporter [Maritalea porphyrae]|jgi:drug/metabolite transporter (DMT)-like permease|uniref:DMT family transporter n=1 Tax=Maritalea porphyrae TaxID=880732 RepID=UPI0022AE82F6|nr:DMT family transporter [Maritalea porphyrae]MCZ4274077.1 DMT family transporter [Maritalea porphyrae]